MSNRNYMFSLKSFANNNPKIVAVIGNQNQPINSNIEGPTGPSGKDGDRFRTKTIRPTLLQPNTNSLIIIHVEPGLAYISGNSVIVAEVADSLLSELNTFEGTIHYYGETSGQLIIKDLTNIRGEFGSKETYYHVNLDGVDGAQGEPGQEGPTGPPGPTSVSSSSTTLDFIDDSITLVPQMNPITYYTLKLNHGNELKNINSYLNNNQTAIIMIQLNNIDVNPHTIAFIFPILNLNLNINYKSVIQLNNETPFAILTLQNIENLLFCDCKIYYKNIYYTNV